MRLTTLSSAGLITSLREDMDTDIDKFKALYFQEFGIDLTDEEVERKALQLKRLYVAVYGVPETTKVNETKENQIAR